MINRVNSYQLKANAALSSYIVLGGPWFLLSLSGFWVNVLHPHSGDIKMALLPGTIGLAFCAWLRGFNIIISDTQFEYRDGFYKSYRIELAEIKEAKYTWVGWKNFGRTIKIPRLVIVPRQKWKSIIINTKPFKKNDLIQLNSVLKQFIKLSQKRKLIEEN